MRCEKQTVYMYSCVIDECLFITGLGLHRRHVGHNWTYPLGGAQVDEILITSELAPT